MRQRRRVFGLVVGLCALLCTLGFAASGASASSLNAYEVSIEDGTALETLALEGFDVVEGRVGESLEIVATRDQVARRCDKLGVDAELKRVDGLTARGYAAERLSPTAPSRSTARTSTTPAPRRPATSATTRAATRARRSTRR